MPVGDNELPSAMVCSMVYHFLLWDCDMVFEKFHTESSTNKTHCISWSGVNAEYGVLDIY